jgi:hypothetical protein
MTSLHSGYFLYWASTHGRNGMILNPLARASPIMCDQGHRRARAAHARRRFGMVGADQRWTANGENEFGFAVDAVDPADIAAARPRYALSILMALFMRPSISISLSMVCSRPRGRQRREFVSVVGRQVE